MIKGLRLLQRAAEGLAEGELRDEIIEYVSRNQNAAEYWICPKLGHAYTDELDNSCC